MNGADILEFHRHQLAGETFEWGDSQPSCDPLNIDPWLAMSLMQKAIRRGRDEWALGAAATLLSISPERLWRRLCVIAYEDIGVADLDTVAIVTAGLKGKTFRAGIGGEWAIACYLARRMCRAAKCRATDDLLVACEQHLDFERARCDLTFKPTPELVRHAVGKGALPSRALALWYAIGTDRCASDFLRTRKGQPQAVFDALCENGFPETVVEVCREGFKKCGEVMPAFMVLLERDLRQEARHVEPDDLPEEELIGGIPC